MSIKYLLTLRKMNAQGKVKFIKHRIMLEPNVREVKELYIDENFIVYLYSTSIPSQEGAAEAENGLQQMGLTARFRALHHRCSMADERLPEPMEAWVDIRSTQTFQLLHSIQITQNPTRSYRSLVTSFHYSKGLFLASLINGFLRVWDVRSGLCVATISGLTLRSSKFRFVADNKYLVGISRSEWTDGLKVWDLQSVLSGGVELNSSVLWTLPRGVDDSLPGCTN